MMYKCVNGVTFEMTEAEEEAFVASFPPPPDDQPEPIPTPEERITKLEETKAEQVDVDELHEALEMILTGAVE